MTAYLLLAQAQNDTAGAPFDASKWLHDNTVPLAVTAAAIVLAFIISVLIARRATRRISDEVKRHKSRRAIAYLSQFLALAVIAVAWAGHLNWQLWVGLVSVGLALALQNVILCIAGWIYLASRRPYDIGDRVQIGNLIGDVVDLRIVHTYLLEVGNWVDADQSTGRVVHVPNSEIFSKPIYNYTQGFPYIWHEIPILVTFESDWRRAREVLERIVRDESRDMSEKVSHLIGRMKRDYPIRFEHLSPIVYTSIRDSGVLLTIRYLTEVRQRRRTHNDICEQVLAAFAAEPSIQFAYPTYRMFHGPEAAHPASGLVPPHAGGAADEESDA